MQGQPDMAVNCGRNTRRKDKDRDLPIKYIVTHSTAYKLPSLLRALLCRARLCRPPMQSCSWYAPPLPCCPPQHIAVSQSSCLQVLQQQQQLLRLLLLCPTPALLYKPLGDHVNATLPNVRVPHPGGYRVLELTAGLKVISIACTPDLRDWGTLLGPLGTLMSLWLAG
jgi:hypothetical protein